MRDDYLFSPGIGIHKFHTRAATWNAARKICNEEGGHLAIVNSKTEARVSSQRLIPQGYPSFLVLAGARLFVASRTMLRIVLCELFPAGTASFIYFNAR